MHAIPDKALLDAVTSTHQCQMFKSLSVHYQAYKTLKIIPAIQPVKITMYNKLLYTTLYCSHAYWHFSLIMIKEHMLTTSESST